MKPAMLALAMFGLAALPLRTAAAPPGPAASPMAIFLHAADRNDFAAMRAVMDPGGASFLKLIGNCYLRRVYSNNATHALVAAWMCAEGPNRSRVVLADVAQTAAGKVSVSLRTNDTNDRPAPRRTGSAFAN